MKRVFILLVSILFLSGCSKSGLKLSNTGAFASSQPITAVELNWVANQGEQDGFTVLQSPDGINFNTVQTIKEPLRAATVSVSSGKTYYFQVQAYNSTGSSPATTSIVVNIP